MAAFHLNASQLKCACLDPQWRAKWLQGKNPSTKLCGPPGSGVVFGSKFHEIAGKFSRWLVNPSNAHLAVQLENTQALWETLYEHFAASTLNQIASKGAVSEALAFKERLLVFCQRLADLRADFPSFTSWASIFVADDYPVKDAAYHLPENHTCFVSGIIDALRFSASGELVIVDYKLTSGTHLKHDLIQLSIYASLLRKADPKLKFHGLLEFYQPKLQVTELQPAELEGIFNDMVQPVIENLSQAQFRRSGPMPSQPASSPPSTQPADGEDHSETIRRCFESFKLPIEILGSLSAPQLIRYRIRPAAGIKVASLRNRAQDLQVALDLPQPPLIEPAAGYVAIDLPRARPLPVPWQEAGARPEAKNHPSPVSFPIGIDTSNHVLLGDFQDPNMAHALVAGASGSGKSEFLKSLAASLVARRASQGVVQLTLIDPKVLTFGALKECPCLTEPVITEISTAITALTQAAEEMDQRYQLLAQEGFTTLAERHLAGKSDIPWRVLIFDEFADLVLAGKTEKTQFETLVARLAAKGRACGIHLVLATQRPDSQIVTGLIKANLPLKICLRVTSAVNSRVVMDATGGELLIGRGDLLCDRGKGIERAQSPFISNNELASLAGTASPRRPSA